MPWIELITDRALSGVESVWRRLAAEDPSATVFQSWEWNATWWRHFGARRRALILVAHGADGPLALAPLCQCRGAGGLFRRIEFLGNGVSDSLGFIGPSDTMEMCARAFLQALSGSQHWDVVDLQQLNPAQASRCGFPAVEPAADFSWEGRPARWSPQDACPVMALPATWDEVLRQVGKKMRYNIGYYERLLCREHDISIEIAAPQEVGAALEELFQLHEQRWRQRRLPGALYSRRLLGFHREVAPALAERGHLALHRLRLGGRTAAALYCFGYAGRAFYYLGGFDPALARYSPGTVLTAHAIRHAIESGCREFDFLRGREAYKYRWPVQDRVNGRLEIAYARSGRPRLALRWNAMQQQLQQVARAAVQNI